MRHPLINRAIFVLSLIGLLIAGALWSWHSHPQDIPCGPSGDCETVANSPYSRLPVGIGPPIAMYGAIGYLAILFLSFLRTMPGVSADGRRDGLVRTLILLGATLGMAFSVRLTYMEINPDYIGAICKWCMASQVIIFLVLGLSLTDTVQAMRGRGVRAVGREGASR